MIVVFASSFYPSDRQNDLLYQFLSQSGREFLFINPLDYRNINKIQLISANGIVKLYFDRKEVIPKTFFYSRLWRTDCIIDFPNNVIYPNIFRQKVNSFLEEIIFCFKNVKSFPGKYGSLQLGESKCAVYELAHSCGLYTPYITTNSFVKPDFVDYKKVIGFPFSISLNTEIREEVAVTLLNEADSGDADLFGLPWQWQTKIRPLKHIRCVAVGDKIWAYSLAEEYLNGRSLREAHEEDHVLNWLKESLPADVENKLLVLLEKVDLEYSSPEFLVDEDGRYIFTDLNPCGDWFGFSNEEDGPEIAKEIVSRL